MQHQALPLVIHSASVMKLGVNENDMWLISMGREVISCWIRHSRALRTAILIDALLHVEQVVCNALLGDALSGESECFHVIKK